MNVPTIPLPAACTCRLQSSSKRASLTTLAGTALAFGAGLHSVRAADDAPKAGDWLVGVDDDAGKPISPADLKADEKQLIAFPYDPIAKRARSESRLNRILLIKLDPTSFDAETAPRAADGVLAYSAICTHQACDVNACRPARRRALCPGCR